MNAEGTTLDISPRCGRIVGPVPYRATNGRERLIPVGACLVERLDAESMTVIWGAHGQRSALLPVETLQAAQALGHLVMLD